MDQNHEQVFQIGDLEQWIEVYGPRLYLFARQQTTNFADAQDLYQETLIHVLKKSKEQGTRIPAPGVFYVCMKNKAIDIHRSRSKRTAREEKYHESTQESWFSIQHEVENKEQSKLLGDILSKLPKEMQEIIVMKIWGELTFKEISEVLSVSSNTIATRYRSALKQLKTSINLQPL